MTSDSAEGDDDEFTGCSATDVRILGSAAWRSLVIGDTVLSVEKLLASGPLAPAPSRHVFTVLRRNIRQCGGFCGGFQAVSSGFLARIENFFSIKISSSLQPYK